MAVFQFIIRCVSPTILTLYSPSDSPTERGQLDWKLIWTQSILVCVSSCVCVWVRERMCICVRQPSPVPWPAEREGASVWWTPLWASVWGSSGALLCVKAIRSNPNEIDFFDWSSCRGCALTNQPRSNLIKWMVGILSPPIVFLREGPAFKLNITRACVLSMRLNIPPCVCTHAAEGFNQRFHFNYCIVLWCCSEMLFPGTVFLASQAKVLVLFVKMV